MTHTKATPDPIAHFRAAASPEQRAACLHPPDDRMPLSGDGWLCGLCGADCAPPEALAEELTAERLDDIEKNARERFRFGHVTIGEKVMAAAVLALAAEVRRLREPPKPAPGQAEDVAHLADLALSEPDEERDCLCCRRTMASPDRSDGEEATPLCHWCAQAALPKLAAEVQRLTAEVWRLCEEATRPAPRSPEEQEAIAIVLRAAESTRAKELAADDLAAIEAAAREDKAVAGRATARPWRWWTANSQRELRSEAGRRSHPVAHGQQHPHDRVIDIAIQEPDMALIERAVNGLEERADTMLRLAREVRRLRAVLEGPILPEGMDVRCDACGAIAGMPCEDPAACALARGDDPSASVEPPRAGEEQP